MPFLAIKNNILGKSYELSLALVDRQISQKINKTYRGKNKPTNVLSFAINKGAGEIILCPSVIKAESKDKTKNFGKSYTELFGFLVIHAMLHLKGLKHGAIMESIELKYDQKYFYRNRRGLRHNQSRSGRVSKRRKKS